MKEYICGNKTNKFSSNKHGNKHFKAFSDEIIKDLELLNIENRLKLIINDYACEYVKQQMQGKSDKILKEMNLKDAWHNTHKKRKTYSRLFKWESVFNLSTKPISPELVKWLKKGPKYNPYVKKVVSTYLKEFDLQFTESLKRVIKYYKGFRSNISFVLHPAKIEATIRGILSKNKNKNLDKVLRKLLTAYILQRRLYNQNIRKLVNTSNTGEVINGSQLDDIFR